MSNGIESRIDRIERLLEQNVLQQAQTQQQLQQLDRRVDEFVYQAQRLFTQHADRLNRLEGQAERSEALIQRLDRNYQEQQQQLAEFRVTTTAALERIDRVLDYLMNQRSGES